MAIHEMRSIDSSKLGINIMRYEDTTKEPIIQQCLVNNNPKRVQNAIDVLSAFSMRVDDIIG